MTRKSFLSPCPLKPPVPLSHLRNVHLRPLFSHINGRKSHAVFWNVNWNKNVDSTKKFWKSPLVHMDLGLVRWSSTWSSWCSCVEMIVVWFVFIETSFLSKKFFFQSKSTGARCGQMPRDTKNPITPLLFFLDYYFLVHNESKSPLNARKSSEKKILDPFLWS